MTILFCTVSRIINQAIMKWTFGKDMDMVGFDNYSWSWTQRSSSTNPKMKLMDSSFSPELMSKIVVCRWPRNLSLETYETSADSTGSRCRVLRGLPFKNHRKTCCGCVAASTCSEVNWWDLIAASYYCNHPKMGRRASKQLDHFGHLGDVKQGIDPQPYSEIVSGKKILL